MKKKVVSLLILLLNPLCAFAANNDPSSPGEILKLSEKVIDVKIHPAVRSDSAGGCLIPMENSRPERIYSGILKLKANNIVSYPGGCDPMDSAICNEPFTIHTIRYEAKLKPNYSPWSGIADYLVELEFRNGLLSWLVVHSGTEQPVMYGGYYYAEELSLTGRLSQELNLAGLFSDPINMRLRGINCGQVPIELAIREK